MIDRHVCELINFDGLQDDRSFPERVMETEAFSRLIDKTWYVSLYPDVETGELDPIDHYAVHGWREGRSPTPLFDAEWYTSQVVDVDWQEVNPLYHYVTIGERAGFTPSPVFDPAWYALQAKVPLTYPGSLLAHYVEHGSVITASPHPLFNPIWYRRHGGGASGVVDLIDYLVDGWRRGASPHPLFDDAYYLAANGDVAAADLQPLKHYLEHGWHEGRMPNPHCVTEVWSSVDGETVSRRDPLSDFIAGGWSSHRSPIRGFDASWYVRQAGNLMPPELDPASHYVWVGSQLGYSPHPSDPYLANAIGGDHRMLVHANVPASFASGEAPMAQAPMARYFALSDSPLVSILVTNWNGERHLVPLFESLAAQSYQNFECIFIDDGSNDGSMEIAARYDFVRAIRHDVSVGFAEANNVALHASRGELICLLNNDTRVDSSWLEHMVVAIKRDGNIAAIAPKIRFWTRFQTFTIRCSQPFTVDEVTLRASLEYKKYFVRTAEGDQGALMSKAVRREQVLVIDLPIQDTPIDIVATVAQDSTIFFDVVGQTTGHLTANRMLERQLTYSETARRESFFVVNNAGSVEMAPLKPGDRGFGERDAGQFEDNEDVDLFCGCAALIRRDALHGRNLFIGEMTAYYEDSELSKRLANQGYKIRYCPSAILYHQHSATNVEKSAFWRIQTSQNAVLFEGFFKSGEERDSHITSAKLHLGHLENWYKSQDNTSKSELGFADAVPKIIANIESIIEGYAAGELPRKAGLRIGIYNPFWSTMGGGEAHALAFSSYLQRFGQVELISEFPFNIEELEQYFGMDLSRTRKRLVKAFAPELTKEYDVIVNSCYQNETPSMAKLSFYIISFPSKTPSPEFLQSYHFIPNSRYTENWSGRFWERGRFSSDIITPAVNEVFVADATADKQKRFLSVGRFASSGHIKNQKEMVEGFKLFRAEYPQLATGWRLSLAGSVNDPEYLKDVIEMIGDAPVDVYPSVPLARLADLYRESYAYIHASGMSDQTDMSPELYEHFGMTVAQGLGSGCVPIVFDAAGPAEIADEAPVSFKYHSIEGMAESMAAAAARYEDPALRANDARILAEAALKYTSANQADELDRVIGTRVRETFALAGA